MRFSVVFRVLSLSLLLSSVAVGSHSSLQAQSSPVVSNGWLQVQRLRGNVTYQGQRSRSARIGDRLSAVGTGIRTAQRSIAALGLDNNIGTVNVAENTNLVVRQLSTSSDGARVTVLDVTQGQARLRVRPFSNPNSRLELHTPSGIAAVRGTEFGVSVSADGQTAVATLEGAVEAIAQDTAVRVEANLVSVIHPGEAPSPPQSLDRELRFQMTEGYRQGNLIYIAGYIDPANTALIEGQEIKVSRQGYLRTSVSRSRQQTDVQMVIRNPLGEERTQTIRFRPLSGDRS